MTAELYRDCATGDGRKGFFLMDPRTDALLSPVFTGSRAAAGWAIEHGWVSVSESCFAWRWRSGGE